MKSLDPLGLDPGRRPHFDSWVRKFPWRREQISSPVFLPGEFQGQRSLVGYKPWACNRLGHNLTTHTHTQRNIARVQPWWIQGIRSGDGIGVRKTYLFINIRLD